MLRVLDLFSGIGGFSLGLERTGGFKTVAFCEIDPYCQKVLKKHWPDVPCHGDITTREFVEGEADVITGGFPCQDLSFAGRGAGLAGERSGLYRELIRAIRLVRPRYAIMENVAALLSRGLGTVLGDLAEIGHDAEWHCIPASAVGAPHRRDRIWIVANPERAKRWPLSGALRRVAGTLGISQGQEGSGWLGSRGEDDSDAAPVLGAALFRSEQDGDSPGIREMADATSQHVNRGGESAEPSRWREYSDGSWWTAEPDVGRVAHGIPARVDRLRGLGNAVVPQIPEIIGQAILEAEGLSA